MSKQVIWNTKKVEEAAEKILNGFTLKKIESPFFDNVVGLRRSGLAFEMSSEELDEYIKCKMDVHYFAENYCWVKGENGDPVKLKLRDYQTEILDNFFNYRFNILMASRQTGKCVDFNTVIYVQDGDGERVFTRIGKLYYWVLSRGRKLTLLERIKIFLYDVIYKLQPNQY
jgi:hypothetical protein